MIRRCGRIGLRSGNPIFHNNIYWTVGLHVEILCAIDAKWTKFNFKVDSASVGGPNEG